MDLVEPVLHESTPLAYIIRAKTMPESTTFVTPNEFNFQLGFVVYPAGGEIQRHVHMPLSRTIQGTHEILFLRKGRCEVDFFTDDKVYVTTRELKQGDLLLMIAGGHGFRLLEDTVFVEIKQGPYTGLAEKERF